jgi:uncharacterized protein involved in propanediol utilization
MPVNGIGSSVRYMPTPGLPLQVQPAWKAKALMAARLTLEEIDAPCQGLLEVESGLTPGRGLGSSTCDVVATIRAVCATFDVRPDAQWIARLAVRAEGAADPVMFDDQMVLFAQRRGEVIEFFEPWMPSFKVLSCDMDPEGAGVDTLSLPPRAYTSAEVEQLEALIDGARRAFRAHDAAAIARVATSSAQLNQRFLPMQLFEGIRDVSARHEALGVQISHSGTIAGVLFDLDVSVERMGCAGAELQALGVKILGHFRSGEAV